MKKFMFEFNAFIWGTNIIVKTQRNSTQLNSKATSVGVRHSSHVFHPTHPTQQKLFKHSLRWVLTIVQRVQSVQRAQTGLSVQSVQGGP